MKRILTLVVGLCLLFSMGCGEDIVIQGDSRPGSSAGASAGGKPSSSKAGLPQTRDRLKAVMIGLHNYHDTFNAFPPPYLKDENGKPAHSWRVLILPMIGENDLYKQYDFNQPWDSEQNQKVMKKIPKIYQTSGSQPYTSVQGIVGKGAVFDPTMKKNHMAQCTDGTSNTAMLIERVNKPVPWTKPEDTSFEDWVNGKSLENINAEGHYVGVVDGSSQYFYSKYSRETRQNYALRNDGNLIRDF